MSYGISPLEKVWPTVDAVMRAQDFWIMNTYESDRPRARWLKPIPFFWYGNHVLIIWRFQFWAYRWCLHIGYMKVRRFGEVLRVVSFP